MTAGTIEWFNLEKGEVPKTNEWYWVYRKENDTYDFMYFNGKGFTVMGKKSLLVSHWAVPVPPKD